MNRNLLLAGRGPLVIGIVLFLATACAPRIPFTQEVRQKYKLTTEDLKAIQFYASQDIVLYRGEKKGSKATEDGTLTVSSDANIETVIIKAGTPGVVDKVLDDKRLAISFETGEGKVLVFGNPTATKGVYKLMAARWANGKGELTYGGKSYFTAKGDQNAYLEFKLKRMYRKKKSAQVVKGRKLD